MSLRVMIAVTHLLGAGHLTRAAALARAFATAGHEVVLASGGLPAPLIRLDGVRLVQLPPVRTLGTDFRRLLDAAGEPVDEACLKQRRDLLVATFTDRRPDVLFTELFPFGRRSLAGEYLALLEAAQAQRPRPLIACSIRDILVAPAQGERIAATHDRLDRLYDLVLAHGDPDLVPLEASWPTDERVRRIVRYTGYVDEGALVQAASERRGILVSGGSSAASLPLYHAALDAAARLTDQPWRVLIGAGVPESDFAALRAVAPGHVMVERARPDFRRLLAGAALSVSQAGYNTVVDILRSGAPAVLVPFEAGHETEQRVRAERLAARGLARVVAEAALSGAALVEAVRAGLAGGPTAAAIDLDGAARSVAIIEQSLPHISIGREGGPWRLLDEALRRAQDAGFATSIWWRDDDAVAPSPALDRLLDLSRRYRIPVALAAIPALAEPALAERLDAEGQVRLLVHGLRHRNHAPPPEKKAEFGRHRPIEELRDEAARALRHARAILGRRLLPVFVPPWNRLDPALAPHLQAAGYLGLSTFGERAAARPAPGLVQVNTHIDPIDWHGARGARDFAGLVLDLARAIDRRLDGSADRAEPIGLLTHHLVHDEALWHLCESLLDRLSRHASVRYPFADELFLTVAMPVAIEP